MDTDFRRRPTDADPNCPKMGQSKRGVEEGGFKIGGVDLDSNYNYGWLAENIVLDEGFKDLGICLIDLSYFHSLLN